MSIVDSTKWDSEIKPKTSYFEFEFKEVFRYSYLLFMFVKRDFVSVYKQTVLGPLWFFIQPILTTLTFTLIFGKIAKLSPTGIPSILFYMSGITIWSYFADCLTQTSDTFIKNAAIFGKVYFPRIIVPIATIVSNLLKFGIQLLLFVIIYLLYVVKGTPVHPQYCYLLLFPLLVLLMAGIGLGLGMIISALTTKYRDLKFLITFGVQLLMYGSSVIIPLSSVPLKYQAIVKANPLTAIVETFKYSVLGQGSFSWGALCYSFIFMIATLFFGLMIFKRVEKTFMDTV